MANIKNTIKVMNFYSLVRVDKAKKDAQKFYNNDVELDKILYQLINNNNLKIDKKMLFENPKGVVLNIYIANDMGFCSDFNTSVARAIREDIDAYKIIVGKKVFGAHKDDKVLLQIQKRQFLNEYEKIDKIIYEYIKEKKVKEINVIYNRYETVNVTDIKLDRKKIFPIEENKDKYNEFDNNIDYIIETDVEDLFANMISLLLCYQIQILERSSWASENVVRERVTRESKKKIEELDNRKLLQARKKKKAVNFKKQINMIRNIMTDE